MSSASLPLQAAILTALAPAVVPVEVYDDVPQGAVFPYVVIGEDTVTDWSAVDREGEEIDTTIHVWSRYAGRKETKELLAKVKSALHGKRLSVVGHHLTDLRFAFETSFIEPDGLTRHGIIRFTARLRRA